MLKALGHRRLRAFLLLALAFTASLPAAAQSPGPPPQLPPGPQPIPGPAPTPFGAIAAENYLVSSSANEHGSYLWIVAPIQHIVILCQKPEPTKDFSCSMKRLP
jgi:hypothetical protein